MPVQLPKKHGPSRSKKFLQTPTKNKNVIYTGLSVYGSTVNGDGQEKLSKLGFLGRS